MVPAVSTSTLQPWPRHPRTNEMRERCCSNGSPPVTTTMGTSMAASWSTTSPTERWDSSMAGSYCDQSHVYLVSHHSQARLQRPRRTKAARRPIDGPSPWKVGPKTSLTTSAEPGGGSDGRVIDAGLGETLGPQGTRIALATRAIAAAVTRPRQVERCARLDAEANDVGLAEVDQRRADLDRPALDPPLQRQRCGR